MSLPYNYLIATDEGDKTFMPVREDCLSLRGGCMHVYKHYLVQVKIEQTVLWFNGEFTCNYNEIKTRQMHTCPCNATFI